MAKPTGAHETEPPDAFRLAFDAAPIGMALVALEGRWLRVNAALCELTGYSEAELLQGRFQDITHPDDLDVDLEYVRQVLARERSSYRMDKRYVRKDGQVVHCSLSVSLAQDAAGNALGFVSQIEDVTDRRRMIAELEQRGRLMDLAHDAILIRDATDGTVTYWNHQAEAVYGYAASAALGRISHDLLRTEFPESRQAIEAALLERGRWDGELWHTRQDGRRILVASRQSLERGPDGEPRAVIELNARRTARCVGCR
jgi:PAS domain S-box-containing protein